MMFTAKVTGKFEEVQSVEATTEQEARELLSTDQGETLERKALEPVEITELAEVTDEDIIDDDEEAADADEVEPEMM